MKIIKQGDYYHAVATEDNELDTAATKGEKMATFSTRTKKISGTTAFFTELIEYVDEHYFKPKEN